MPTLQWIVLLVLSVALAAGCAGHRPDRSQSPLTIAVGPVFFEAPVTKSKQIHTFEENPDADVDRQLLPVLIDDLELRAQRFLTEEFNKIPGIHVIPFEETRRLLPDITSSGRRLTDSQIQALGRQTGADHVVTGVIHDYGRVRWQYWVTGWLAHAVVEMSIVGVLSGWEPRGAGRVRGYRFHHRYGHLVRRG